LLHTVNDTAMIVTLAAMTGWFAGIYAQILTKGKRDKGFYWRNICVVLVFNWAFNVVMFTMFYVVDGTLPQWNNWAIEIGFTLAFIVFAWYINPNRRRNKKR